MRFHPLPLPVRSLTAKGIFKVAVLPMLPENEYDDEIVPLNEPAEIVPCITGESARAGILVAGSRSPVIISSMQSALCLYWQRKCSIRFNIDITYF